VIESFSGNTLKAEFIQEIINHPCNAMNIQNDAHDSMDKAMAWGIEAVLVSDNEVCSLLWSIFRTQALVQWRYIYRRVRPDYISFFIKRQDGDEISFGKGEAGNIISLPNPKLCNLHLAIARVSYACGAAEIFDQFLEDEDEDGFQVPVYFGSPFVSDETLMRKLEVLVNR
jgi:hypothetical protein